jgi:hypothetical protein
MIIKRLNTGEYKVKCPSCLNNFRVAISDYTDDVCATCRQLKETIINEIQEITCEIIDITPQETSGRLEIPEPFKESLVPFVVQEIIMVNPIEPIEVEDVTKEETEKIIKKKPKKVK